MFHKLLYRVVLRIAFIIFKALYKMKVHGKKHIIKGGAIIAPNHTSYLDPPIVAAACPEEIHFLARQTLFQNVFGKFISALNAHPVEKKTTNLSVLKLVNKLLKEGKKVLLFPEGTRSFNNKLQDIQPGIGMLISKSESAIIPTFIDGTYKIWDRKRAFPKLFGKVTVIFGSPIYWKDFKNFEKKEAQKLIAKRLTHAILDLERWYKNGSKGLPP